MRKYLLLATTAMLFAGNAMADTSEVATDGQSARMDVYASIRVIKMITSVTDMKYGTIFVPSSIQEGDKIATLSTGGEITLDKGVKSSGTPAAGTVTADSEVNFTVTCGYDADDGGCHLEGVSGQALSVHVTPTSGTFSSNEKKYFGGDLYFVSPGTSGHDMDAKGSITITLSY